MNPSFHEISSVIATRVRTEAGIDLEQFTLAVQYRPGGERHRISGVYVPPELKRSLGSGDVAGIYVETLPVGGLESWLLPHEPSVILLGTLTRAGEWLAVLPKRLHWAKRVTAVGACLSSGVAIYLLQRGQGWLGALALVCGAQLAALLRRQVRMPRAPLPRA